jgi:ribosomal protein S18 acetylase RimI-like enzyme
VSESPLCAVRVERARAGDASSLAQLAAQSLPEPWSAAGFEEEIAAEEGRVWLVRDPAGDAIAYLAARRAADELEILSLAVATAWRRSGLGTALVAYALAQERALAVAHLEVRSDDAGALAFYAGLGFRRVGSRPGFYRGGIDAVTMTRMVAR